MSAEDCDEGVVRCAMLWTQHLILNLTFRYSREWRYHTEEKVWITQAPGLGAVEKTSTYERGTYYFFDAQNWRKVAKEFHLDYNKLEGRPQLPSILPPQPV